MLTVLAHVGLLLLLLSLAPRRIFAPVLPPPGTLTVTLNPAEEQARAAPSRRAVAPWSRAWPGGDGGAAGPATSAPRAPAFAAAAAIAKPCFPDGRLAM